MQDSQDTPEPPQSTLITKVKNKVASRRDLVIIGILLIVIFFIWKQTSSSGQKVQYQTTKAQRDTVISTVAASGQILTTNNVSLSTNASGVVKTVFVSDGATVAAGDKIMEISLDQDGQIKNAQTYASYLSAKNSLDSASATQYSLQSDMFTKWKTYTALATTSTYQNSDGSPNNNNRTLPEFHTTQDDWLAAEAKYKNQQAVIVQAQAAVNSTWLSYQQSAAVIAAPIAGTISNITYVPGMVLGSTTTTTAGITSQQAQRVAVIKNNGTPLSTVNVSEIDVYKIKPGQKVTITLDSIPGKTFTGKVMSVDRIGAVSSGVTNYPVVIQLDVASEQILPNMAVSANIIVDTKDNVLVVPSAAVQTQTDQSTVRILRNGQPQSVTVEVGISSDTKTEITSGLSEGDEVVTGTQSQNTSTQTTTSPFGGGLRFGGFGGGGGGAAVRGR